MFFHPYQIEAGTNVAAFQSRTKIPLIKWMTAPDGFGIRYGIWPVARQDVRGSILVLSGRCEFLEKYAETIQELHARGWMVFSLDWRGQGLSTRPLANRHKGFIQDYVQYDSDLSQFIREVMIPQAPKPLTALAHSMGGHILLRYLHDHPEVFRCAGLTSPMIDILTPPFPVQFAKALTRLAVRLNQSEAYAFGETDYHPPDALKIQKNILTRDLERFMDMHRAIQTNPELALGGVTWGWLAATFASIDHIHGPKHAENIPIPIQIIGAGADKVVSLRAMRNYAKKLQKCNFDLISKSYHEILKEKTEIRNRFWNIFDRFMNKNS